MMLANALVASIRSDTDCLWTLTKTIIFDSHTDKQARDAIDCYHRLKESLSKYHENRIDILDSAYVWFAEQVLGAFEEAHKNFISHAA